MKTRSGLQVSDSSQQGPGQSSHQPSTSPALAQTSLEPAPKPVPGGRFEDTGSGSFNQLSAPEKICTATARRSGAPCQAYARPTTGFCIFHDPGYRETQRQNSSNAGRASGIARQSRPVPLPHLDISTPQSRANLFGYLIAATLTGRISESQSNAIHRSLSMVIRDTDESAPFAALRNLYR